MTKLEEKEDRAHLPTLKCDQKKSKTRLKILPVLTREPYTSLLHFLLN
jgi:hypothetical protein